MIDDLFAQFEGAFADSTIRSYRSDFSHFSDWCEENGIDAASASREDLAQFVEHMAAGSSGATIRRHVASIGSIYKLSGKDDISKGPPVILAMKRMYRRKGRAQRQATPLTYEALLCWVCAMEASAASETGYCSALAMKPCAGGRNCANLSSKIWRFYPTVRRPCTCGSPRPTSLGWAS